MRICIDTNAYTAFKQGDEVVTDLLENAEEVILPSVVLGELYAGFYQGRRMQQNIRELKTFLELPGVSVAPIETSTAERYGIIVKQLRGQGTPVPTNDIWIAAINLELGARLLSRDEHFSRIPGVFAVPL